MTRRSEQRVREGGKKAVAKMETSLVRWGGRNGRRRRWRAVAVAEAELQLLRAWRSRSE
jgi:hypothetical protein